MVSAILWILIGMYLPNTGVATLLDPFYDAHPDVSRLVMFIGVILISVLALILFKRWFSPEYEGSMNTKGLAYGFKIILPIVVFIAVYKAFKVAVGHSFASAFGVVFGVIFTLSGNIWPCIFLHSLYDTLAFSSTSADAKPDMAVYFEVAVYCIFMILYLILLYGKREKASALWNRKWNADSLSHSPAADGCEP